jgi:hypothetical protein
LPFVLAQTWRGVSLAGMPAIPRLVPLSPPSSGPSAFYRQHARIEEPAIDGKQFRPACRRVTQVDKLLSSGAITAREWRRADEFRRCYEHAGGDIAASKADAAFLDPHCRQRGRAKAVGSRLEAARKLTRWRGELGEVVYSLVTMVAVEDACWAAIGRRFTVDPKTGRAWAITALQALAATK